MPVDAHLIDISWLFSIDSHGSNLFVVKVFKRVTNCYLEPHRELTTFQQIGLFLPLNIIVIKTNALFFISIFFIVISQLGCKIVE